MNQRPKQRRAASAPAAAASTPFALPFAGFSGGDRRLILAEQRVGDAVDAAAAPRRRPVAAI